MKNDISLQFQFTALQLLLKPSHNNNLHFLFCELSLNFHSYFSISCPSAAILIPNLRSRKSHHYPFLGLHLAQIKIHREKQWRRDPQFMSPQTLNQESDLHSCAALEAEHTPFLRPLVSAKVLRQIC